MTLSGRLRANAAALQHLQSQGRGVPHKRLAGLVADLLRDAAEADDLAEAEAFIRSEAAGRQTGRAAA